MGKNEEKEIRELVKKEKKKISSQLRGKHANMYRDAKKPEDVQVYLEG